MNKPLTKTAVDALAARAPTRPGEKAKPAMLWDGELRGFGVLALPSGIKSYVVQYRNLAGRSKRLTIGRHGVFTVAEARMQAKAILLAVAKGEDPVADRREARTAIDVNALLDRYLKEHVAAHNAATTRREVERLLNARIRPALGRLTATAVTPADVSRLHSGMAKTPRQANLALAIVSKAFALAELWGLRAPLSNPARGIRRFSERERERFLSADELGKLGAAILEAQTIGLPWNVADPASRYLPKVKARRSPANPQGMTAITLLLFTGARLSEILELKWAHVDLAAGTIALPSRKGDGRRAHPVSEPVLELLRGLPRVAGSPWVLPRASDKQRHVSKEVVESTWQKLRRTASLDDVRLHDLRHTVGTYAGQAGGNSFLISHVLRHRNVSITNRYVNPDHEPIRALSEMVGDRIAAGLGLTRDRLE